MIPGAIPAARARPIPLQTYDVVLEVQDQPVPQSPCFTFDVSLRVTGNTIDAAIHVAKLDAQHKWPKARTLRVIAIVPVPYP
jgi:hypothetical protein